MTGTHAGRLGAKDPMKWKKATRCSSTPPIPEETRVVVLRNGRVEEFDYESAARKLFAAISIWQR